MLDLELLFLGGATNVEIERLMSLPSNLSLKSSDTADERDIKAVFIGLIPPVMLKF
jgi:hypothetical protein